MAKKNDKTTAEETAVTAATPEAPQAKETAPGASAAEPESCGNCVSFRNHECHHFPKQVTSALFSGWPPAVASEWCRQWEAR